MIPSGIGALFGLLLQGLEIPRPTGFVNDFAGVIPAEQEGRIERIVADVRARSRGEIVVVTLADLRGRDRADVAREIGRQWGVGAAGEIGAAARNAGVIILVIPRETSSDGRGHLRIEVGSGAEGFITDATAGAIQDEALPHFRAGDYGAGIELMTLRVAERFAREFGFQLDSAVAAPLRRTAETRRDGNGGGIPPLVLIIIIFLVLSMMRRRGRRRGCAAPILIPMSGGHYGGRRSSPFGRGGGFGGGGFGGGGFGGFGGGGGFSGGGAGRSW